MSVAGAARAVRLALEAAARAGIPPQWRVPSWAESRVTTSAGRDAFQLAGCYQWPDARRPRRLRERVSFVTRIEQRAGRRNPWVRISTASIRARRHARASVKPVCGG